MRIFPRFFGYAVNDCALSDTWKHGGHMVISDQFVDASHNAPIAESCPTASAPRSLMDDQRTNRLLNADLGWRPCWSLSEPVLLSFALRVCVCVLPRFSSNLTRFAEKENNVNYPVESTVPTSHLGSCRQFG